MRSAAGSSSTRARAPPFVATADVGEKSRGNFRDFPTRRIDPWGPKRILRARFRRYSFPLPFAVFFFFYIVFWQQRAQTFRAPTVAATASGISLFRASTSAFRCAHRTDHNARTPRRRSRARTRKTAVRLFGRKRSAEKRHRGGGGKGTRNRSGDGRRDGTGRVDGRARARATRILWKSQCAHTAYLPLTSSSCCRVCVCRAPCVMSRARYARSVATIRSRQSVGVVENNNNNNNLLSPLLAYWRYH